MRLRGSENHITIDIVLVTAVIKTMGDNKHHHAYIIDDRKEEFPEGVRLHRDFTHIESHNLRQPIDYYCNAIPEP